MRARAEALDSAYLRTGGGPLSLAGGQLWLRQSDALADAPGDPDAAEAADRRGVAILHATRVTVHDGKLAAGDVSVFRLSGDDRLLQRIEAPQVVLEPGNWELDAARVIVPGRLPSPPREVDVPTDFTVSRVQESFAPPDTFSVWALPSFIDALERSGFSAVRHRLHFQALLALPLLCGTMCLLAAGFSMRSTRRGGVAQMVGSGGRGWFCAVHGQQGGAGVRPIGRPAARAGRLGARRRWPALVGVVVAPSGRRLMAARRMCRALLVGVALGTLGVAATAELARAQFAATGPGAPVRRDQPVYYLADRAEYDRDRELVTLSGRVEIWQGDRVMRADTVTYDRKTATAAATGHVVLLEPDGQVLFSEYAELTGSMKDGVLRNMSAQLAENGKLVANGGRRTGGTINELSRAVYSTCNVCAKHPEQAPLWQLRARAAVQDTEHKKIEYRDVVLDLYGVPVLWLPYLTHADPSAKRASGFLIPSAGESSHIGTFFAAPYYWAIDPHQDVVLTPLVATKAGPALDATYRRRFNSGDVTANASVAYDASHLQGHVFAKGQFVIDDEWRWGFNVNEASSAVYLRDFKVADVPDYLSSNIYLEGFGQGAYSRLDTKFYQGISTSIDTARLPYVLPRYEYSFQGQPGALGGHLNVDTQSFNVIRETGTNTARTGLVLNWERPAVGALGDVWKATLNLQTGGYESRQLDASPSWGPRNAAGAAQAMPTAALELRWPFSHSGDWGTQVIEPRVQLVGAPNASGYRLQKDGDGTLFVNSAVPNEDSLVPELSDSNLFSLNRFPGIDRLEGGLRANVALHAAWDWQGGDLDALVGQSYREHKDAAFPVGSGLSDRVSDIVGHVNLTPSPYFDLSTQGRFDHRTGHVRVADALASAGPSWLRVNAGYIYSTFDPYFYYDTPPTGTYPLTPRNEVTLGANAVEGRYKLGAYVRRNLQTRKLVAAGFSGSYEDECFVFSGSFFRRYTSLVNDSGGTTVLFQVTLKTVGTFGFHAF